MPNGLRWTRKTPRLSKVRVNLQQFRACQPDSQADRKTTSDYDREKLQERLAKLAGGVAVINVGAATETEMKEKKARVEDALHATRAAVEEGVVAGGGVALMRTQSALDKLEVTGDEAIGVQIISRCLEAPLRQLVANAGLDASIVVAEVRKAKGTFGYNVATAQYTDLVKDGVIDPAKVTRSAIQNAASIAGLLLTTECMVTDIPEKDKPRRRRQVAAWAVWTGCIKPFDRIFRLNSVKNGAGGGNAARVHFHVFITANFLIDLLR